jgi:hypothetical protein
MMALWSGLAHALSPCEPDGGLAAGPTAAALWDGGLGLAHRVCPRTEAGLAPRALLLVDTPNFYGQIVATAALDASVAADDRTEVWLHLEPVRYQNVISAIPASFVGHGFTTLGASRQLDGAGATVTALQGQLVLPSAIELQGRALPFALELGLGAERALSERWSAHGRLGAATSASFSRGPLQPRAGVLATVGAAFRAGRAFAAVLDAQTSFAYTSALDHVALAPGLRFAAGPVGFELAAAVPLAGRERTLAVVELHSTLRF